MVMGSERHRSPALWRSKYGNWCDDEGTKHLPRAAMGGAVHHLLAWFAGAVRLRSSAGAFFCGASIYPVVACNCL